MSNYLYSPYEGNIWAALMRFLNNEYAVAGIMGWWVGESGLYPSRAQGDYVLTNETYPKSNTITGRIDSYKNQSYEAGLAAFAGIGDNSYYTATWYINGNRYGPGYGLAQWTGSGRKKLFYDWWRTYHPMLSIGSAELQCEWCAAELRGYYGVCYSALLSASSVRDAMYTFGYWYETGGSATMAQSITAGRISYGNALYNKYHGTSPGGDPEPPIDPIPDIPDWPGIHGNLPVWLLKAAIDNRKR